MKSERSPISAGAGFSTLESILASAMLLVLTTIFINALISGQEGISLASYRRQALSLAEEGLEAVRNIKQENFSNLVDGTYGLATSSNQWILSGSQDTTAGLFTRQITIRPVDADTKEIEATVFWQQNLSRTASTTLMTRLTNWTQITADQATTLAVNTANATRSGDNKEIRNVTLTNSSPSDSVIASMTISWDGSPKIERIKIEGDTVWSKSGPGSPSGTQVSGTQLNIQDYTLKAGEDEDIDNIKFTASMAGKSVTISLTMGDGSEKTFTVF